MPNANVTPPLGGMSRPCYRLPDREAVMTPLLLALEADRHWRRILAAVKLQQRLRRIARELIRRQRIAPR